MKLPHGAWVVVADGERLLVLENRGDAEAIDLRVMSHATLEARRETEGAGRVPLAGGRRETVAATDWTRLDRMRFVSELAARLDAEAAAGAFATFAVAADPRTLGALRMQWTARVRARLAGEIAAVLTRASVAGIEAAVRRA